MVLKHRAATNNYFTINFTKQMCVYKLGFAHVLGKKNHPNYSYSLLLQQKVKKKKKNIIV